MLKNVCFLNFFLIFTYCSSYATSDTRTDSSEVINYHINLSIRNLSQKNLTGFTSIKLRSKVDQLNYAMFDLLNMQILEVKFDDSLTNYEYHGNKLFVAFKHPLAQGDSAIITVTYSGQPAADPRWGGFYFTGNYAFNMGVGFDANPHNFGRCWFPCYDNFITRSTADCHITTDSGYRAICGGLPAPETINPDGSVTWHWQLNQAVPSYLISVAVGKYSVVNQTSQMPVTTYLVAEAKDTANLKISFTNLKKAYETFVQLFGPYRFDRVGFVGVPFNAGAMEHATNIAYPLYAINGALDNETLMAHELSHHWWGDLVTCRTAEDMWLNEGWASYCESLFLEFAYSKSAYRNEIKENNLYVQRNAQIRDSGYRAVAGVPHQFTYGDHVYKKGALMMHNLRTYMGDTPFFNACKSYLNKYAFKDVSTTDLMNEFKQYADTNMVQAFFDNWILNPGFPAFKISSVTRNQAGSNWEIKLKVYQLLKAAPALFKNVPLTITFGNETMAIKRNVIFTGKGANAEEFSFNLPFNPALVVIDAEEQIADGVTQVIDTLLSNGIKTYPDALMNLTNLTIPSGTKPIVHIEHFWTRADQEYNTIPGLYVSNYRHWKVSGIWPAGFKAEAFLNYDGSTPVSGGHLDHTLIGNTEDSLVLLWRPTPESTWEIVADPTALKQTGATVTDKIGRFWVKDLKQGEYTFAAYNKNLASVGAVPLKQRAKKAFRIAPNPAQSFLTITALSQKEITALHLIDSKGVNVLNKKGETNEQTLDISHLSKGVYTLTITSGTYSESHQVVIGR